MRTLSKILSSFTAFSLFFLGAFLLFSTPQDAKAGFFSSVLGTDASASTEVDMSVNSQNMGLLQANISSVSIIEEKNQKKDEKKGKEVDLDTSVNILSENAILPIIGPLGVSDGKEVQDVSALETSVYVVRKGDTVSAIAKMFDVSENTILSANDMKKGEKLKEGDVLFILPISGLKHIVAKGQTLKTIAKMYKVEVSDITEFNDISEDEKLSIGGELIIPNGVKVPESGKPVQNLKASIEKDNKYYENHPIQNLVNYFVNPVPGYRKSQGIHDRNAIDLAIAKGTPIHAAATGRVTLARTGYNGGFGTLVIIAHPNGTETLYAHMSKLGTHTGDQVEQGEVIGYVGSTGRSTGPHLHLEVHGARNPGADNSWAN